jgi:hypothetical protein
LIVFFSCYKDGEEGDEEPEAETSDDDSDESETNDEVNNEIPSMLAIVKNSGIVIFAF